MMSEKKAKEDMLLWMDVETTGLDPDHDRILEVEMRCTDMRGVRCVGGFRRVIGLKGRKASITDGNLEAWRMHCANGLLEGALDAGSQRPPHRHMPRPRHPPIRAHHPPPGLPSGPIRRRGSSKVMSILAVILLCAAILIGWMANRP